MSHDLLIDETGKAKFLDSRGPAWHRMGIVKLDPTNAVEGLEAVGEWFVEQRAIQTVDGMPLTQRAIVRSSPGLEPSVLGVVSDSYTLISPRQFCELFDAKIGASIETLGAIRDGGILFVSTKMPSMDIKGDELIPYFLATNGMNGTNGVSLMVTHVRVVCQNTLMAAESGASETVRLRHDEKVTEQLEAWMAHLYASAEARAATLEASYSQLAETKATKTSIKAVLNAAYPLPKAPALDMPPSIAEQARRNYENLKARMVKQQETAEALFLGAGTGAELPAAAGTLWGLWNAVVEAEDYRNGGSADTLAESAVFGNRARNKQRAYAAALKAAK